MAGQSELPDVPGMSTPSTGFSIAPSQPCMYAACAERLACTVDGVTSVFLYLSYSGSESLLFVMQPATSSDPASSAAPGIFQARPDAPACEMRDVFMVPPLREI